MIRSRSWVWPFGLVALTVTLGACGNEGAYNKVEKGGMSIWADETEGLVDGQEIEVTVLGAEPGDWVVECVVDNLRQCWTGVNFDTFGVLRNGSAVIDVRQVVKGVDCAEQRGRCVVRLARGDEVAVVPDAPVLPLTFVASVP